MTDTDKQGTALLEVRGVTKTYPGVRALRGVDLTVQAGEVHALVGENGAGKSTLIKILAGAQSATSGVVRWAGEPVTFRNPFASQRLGISVIHQELDLVPDLSAAENMLMGRNQPRRWGVTVNWHETRRRAQVAADTIGIDFDLRTPVHELNHAQRVLVAIARALTTDARLIIMDEPTTALSATEADRLHEVIRSLAAKGTAIIYVSHRLDEVLLLSQTITIFKDGALIGSYDRSAIAHTEELADLIIGKEGIEGRAAARKKIERRSTSSGEVAVELRDVSYANKVDGVSLSLRRGEILGLAGLVGSGRSEIANMIFGALKPSSGTVLIDGTPLTHPSPARAAKRGVALIPEDRRHQAVIGEMSIRENMTLASMARYCLGPFISRPKESRSVQELISRFRIKVSDPAQPIRTLSGGNQQKVVVARWVDRSPKVLLFDEPTQGIDVGAKAEVFRIMRDLADEGCAVLFISSEFEELVDVVDRAVVMREGRVITELSTQQISVERILRACFGTDAESAEPENSATAVGAAGAAD